MGKPAWFVQGTQTGCTRIILANTALNSSPASSSTMGALKAACATVKCENLLGFCRRFPLHPPPEIQKLTSVLVP